MAFRSFQKFHSGTFSAFSDVIPHYDDKGNRIVDKVTSSSVPDPADFKLKDLIAAGAPLRQLNSKIMEDGKIDLGIFEPGHVEDEKND